jgi:hypothetical protein
MRCEVLIVGFAATTFALQAMQQRLVTFAREFVCVTSEKWKAAVYIMSSDPSTETISSFGTLIWRLLWCVGKQHVTYIAKPPLLLAYAFVSTSRERVHTPLQWRRRSHE